LIELFVAFGLIALNAVFALSELAVVSSRKSRLAAMARTGRAGARAALALADSPGRFLSAVQIGITLIGILAGAFSGAALGASLTVFISGQGAPLWIAEAAGFGLVLGGITYLSVVVGELVPKQLALRDPEAVACVVAGPMTALTVIAGPVVWLLDASTRLVFKMFGAPASDAATVTEEEIKTLLAEAAGAGVIARDEHHMIAGVLRMGDRAARSLMTPRMDVEWLDLSRPMDDVLQSLRKARHARLPVSNGSPDEFLGVLRVQDVLDAALAKGEPDIRALLKQAPIVPDGLDALDLLATLKAAETPMALVHDEYGDFKGLATPADVLDAIAGAFRSDEAKEDAVRRQDGSWLIAGATPADEVADLLGFRLPEGEFETIAGLIIHTMRRLPATGETIAIGGWRFEVVDLDGRRVDKLLASRLER
jgi:putative hemolysin